ncbi:SDR family NAD(P)-dependent oxidoreductase [Paenibacillus sp. NAIST15-1]|uniref:SDR family NAD(P)-dependent oxidoreductase n=1 Tax=Paenibacillus sp. NAIST15-1 TaxID=1605994 RepID=UPI000869C4AA|nr:SDR family NAD(P)-dependent oxidoreductase [Paenibacillus sp. NAIST15-1]GAV14222.1 polyketide synthase [Paenibacillus sp. NAIST15-1]
MLNVQGLTLRDAKNDEAVEEVAQISSRDIAVIGIALDFPQARTVEEFWENVREGKDCISGISKHRRRDMDRYLSFQGLDLEDDLYSQIGFLDEIDKFDHRFFNLSPLEAGLMDPGQRLFLQCAWQALEDAGYAGDKIKGRAVGVYVGQNVNLVENYYQYIRDVEPESMNAALPGNLAAMVASRISYFLDFSGPSMVVNTACSSSLVAVHLASQALRTGDCEIALVGGVSLNLLPLNSEPKFGKSSTGRAYTFDDRADGTSDGEGVAAVLLKPLKQAVDDRDHIYAVIKGSAVNQDGSTNGITAPSTSAQASVIERAWKASGINPETIGYIEAHGTATELGDPIEIDGVTQAFRRFTDRKQFCGIGSLKPNIGHLDAAAGIAGLIKAALALHHKELPPSIHFLRPNRNIRFQHSPVYLQDSLETWETVHGSRRCGVSSFGLSGTNAHVVLEEAPRVKGTAATVSPRIFTVSAKSITAMESLLVQYQRLLVGADEKDFAAICYTASTGRGHFRHRVAVVAVDAAELLAKLNVLTEYGLDTETEGVFYYEHALVPASKTPREKGDLTEAEAAAYSEQARKLVSLVTAEAPTRSIMEQIGRLYVQGAGVEWECLYEPAARRRVLLPLYPFDRIRCWLELPELVGADGLFFGAQWEEQPIERCEPVYWKGRVLLLKGKDSLSDKWAVSLREAGASLITVELGEEYRQYDPASFVVSSKEEDYLRLMQALQRERITHVLHFFSFDQSEGISSLHRKLDRSGNSLFCLLKAINQTHAGDAIEFVLAAPTGHAITKREEKLNSAYTTMFGLGKSVAAEHPHWSCRCLDADESLTGEQLVAELSDANPPYIVAYREGRRYLHHLAAIPEEAMKTAEVPIRSEGVYVIAGGAGGMGLEIAKWLASKKQVTLALVNRTPMPLRSEWEHLLKRGYPKKERRKIEAIRELEASGAKVLLCEANVADEQAVRQLLAGLRERFGGINGIVHCAGVPGSGMIWSKTKAEFDRVLSAKLYGTRNLDEATKSDRLDFFVMFSAITALTGGFGQGDYTAANVYLDAFAAERAKRGGRTLAINWSVWKETGMGVDFGIADQEHIFQALRTEQAIEAFEKALGSSLTQVAIGRINRKEFVKVRPLLSQPRFPIRLHADLMEDLDRMVEKNGRKQPAFRSAIVQSAELTGRPDGDYSDMERTLGRIWLQTMGVKQMDIYDTFYELGGDSIFATKIVNHIREELGVQLSIVEFLQNLTIAGLSAYLTQKQREGGNSAISSHSIPPAQPASSYPVTSAQRRLYFLHELHPEQQAYNVTMVLRIEGSLERERFERAFQTIVDRHEMLRTYFELENGEPVQKIAAQIASPIRYMEADEYQVTEIVHNSIRPFKLNESPLLRILLISLSQSSYVLVVDLHHIIADGFSVGILAEEFMTLYGGQQLPALPVQFKDYSVWHNKWMNSQEMESHEAFWLSQFADKVQDLGMVTDYPRPVLQSFAGDKRIFTADCVTLEQLQRLAAGLETTMFMLLLAAYNVLLAKVANQDDIVVGSPIAGRTVLEVEPLIGMFANTVVFRNRPKDGLTFAEFLAQVKENALAAYAHQEYPFERLIGRLGLGSQLNRNPLFDVMFVMHNEYKTVLDDNPLRISSFPIPHRIAKVDLTLEATIDKDELALVFEYCTDLFRCETVEHWGAGLLHILQEVVNNPDVPIRDIVWPARVPVLKNVLPAEIDFKF